MPSNAIIVGGVAKPIPPDLSLDCGVRCRNFDLDGEWRFSRRRKFRKSPRHIVIHESAGGVDGYATIRSLERRGYGVHLVIHSNGNITNHGDLVQDRLVHANQCNSTSIGVEVINPYYGWRRRGPYTRVMPGSWWTHRKRPRPFTYLLPTPEQMRTLLSLVPWLCEVVPSVPYTFPTSHLGPKQRRIRGWRRNRPGDDKKTRGIARRPKSGIVAHRDFASHADGRYILEELIKNQVVDEDPVGIVARLAQWLRRGQVARDSA